MDRKEYFPKVESYLGKYMKWKSRVEILKLELAKGYPEQTTPTYSDMPPTFTNQTSDKTATAVIDRIDKESEYNALSERVWMIEIALQALSAEEQVLFNYKYVHKLDHDSIQQQMGLSRTKFFLIRGHLVDTVNDIIGDRIY